MAPTSLKLISYRLCPFVQRALILLSHKHIAHETTYVDLDNPPDWFSKLSPRGKIPILRINDETTIFESAVICEYLDEVTPPPLMPADPLIRAMNRSWIEYATTPLMPLRDITTAETAAALRSTIADFQDKLDPLEEELGKVPYFNGGDFSLVDAAYAPLFVRLDYFEKYLETMTPANRFPNLIAWRTILTEQAAVQESIGNDFSALMDVLVAKRQGHLATFLPDTIKTSGPRKDY